LGWRGLFSLERMVAILRILINFAIEPPAGGTAPDPTGMSQPDRARGGAIRLTFARHDNAGAILHPW